MPARADEVMAIPVDANARISKSLVTAIERDVLIDLSFVLIEITFHAIECRLFFNCEDEDKVAFGFDLRLVQRSNRREQGSDVARVITNSRRVNSAIAHGRFDLQARLKDRVHVRVKDDHRSTTGPL